MDLKFPGQREGEKVLCMVRKHPVVYVRIIAAFLMIFVLPSVVFWLLFSAWYPLEQNHETAIIAGIFICMFILYGLLFTAMSWIDEEFDIFIITTDRLVDITQISFFKRSVTSTPLEQIQDTTGSIKGFVPTLLRYGDLAVQTAAGSASEFFIDRIPEPDVVGQKILDWAHKKREGLVIHCDD